jgi:uncharacterized membrane protein YfcA
MFGSDRSRRNAIAMSIGWWYLRRLIRKRGAAALAGFVAGEGLSLARRRRGRRLLRRLLVVGLVVAGGVFWWRRRERGDDGWGDWDPVPTSPDAPEAAPEPAPVGEPVAK